MFDQDRLASRRLQLLLLDPLFVRSWMAGNPPRIRWDLPADATILTIQADTSGLFLLALIHSATFPVVPPNEVPPRWVGRLIHDNRRERLAAYAHNAWAGWMRYLWSKSVPNPDGTRTIAAWAVKRWERQMATPYADLPEDEKHSDRAEADKMLHILEGAPDGA